MLISPFIFSEAKSACTKAGIINFQDKYLQRNFFTYKADRVYSLVQRLRYAKVIRETVVFLCQHLIIEERNDNKNIDTEQWQF